MDVSMAVMATFSTLPRFVTRSLDLVVRRLMSCVYCAFKVDLRVQCLILMNSEDFWVRRTGQMKENTPDLFASMSLYIQ